MQTKQELDELADKLTEALCPHFEDHTPAPKSYLHWHSWADKMSKTHRQRKCAGCGRFEIWEPKNAAALRNHIGDSHV